MSTIFHDSVLEFRKAFGLPTNAPESKMEVQKNLVLQHRLLTSEAIEFLTAVDNNDKIEQYDAVIDMLYVWYGMGISMGKVGFPPDNSWESRYIGNWYGEYPNTDHSLYLPAVDIIYNATVPLSKEGQGGDSSLAIAAFLKRYHETLERVYNKIAALIVMLEMPHELVHDMFVEVHESNMTKLDENGNPIYNEFGKVIKSNRYRQPDIHGVVLSYQSRKGI